MAMKKEAMWDIRMGQKWDSERDTESEQKFASGLGQLTVRCWVLQLMDCMTVRH